MEQFWGLTKSDYRFEVYKIINEVSIWLKQEHIDFFFDNIQQIPSDKMGQEEFQCLSELGKHTTDPNFKSKVVKFFWDIVCESDQYKEDLVNNCISKFAEMVKYWDVKLKHNLFLDLGRNLQAHKSSIPSIKLFKQLIKDQKDR